LLDNLNDHLFVGILLKDISYNRKAASYAEENVHSDISLNGGFLIDEDEVIIEAISQFEKAARDSRINYEIYNDFRLTAHEVVKQSTFADMLILSSRIFFNAVSREPDAVILYQILKYCKCPVLILPDGAKKIDNIIFTYDNKASSVFAIKAFSSLFPSCKKNKIVSVLSVKPNVDEEIKNERLLMNLVKQHYSNVGIQLLEGENTSKEIGNFARNVQNPLVVMGAFVRSHISNLLLSSAAQHLFQKSDLSLFIAHR